MKLVDTLSLTGVNYAVHKNGIVYAVAGNSLKVINFSTVPASLITSVTLPGTGYVVKVKGNIAYVGGANFFRRYDIGNPAEPILKGTMTVGALNVEDIELSGSYAYLAAYGSSYKITIVDVSNPDTFLIITDITGFTEHIVEIAVQGNRLYAVEDWNSIHPRLHIYDITDPTTPVQLIPDGYSQTGFRPRRIVVEGDYAYVSDYFNYSSGFYIYDISQDTYNLVKSLKIPTQVATPRLQKIGNYIYLGDRGIGGYKIYKINVSNPASPAIEESITSATNQFSISSLGYMVQWDAIGVSVYDLELGIPVQKANITIKSNPPGAEVYFDGYPLGIQTTSSDVNVTVYLESQTEYHNITLKLYGYDEYSSEQFALTDGVSVLVDATLNPIPKSILYINTTPETGATVTINDGVADTVLLEKTNTSVELYPGDYWITVRKAMFHDWVSDKITIERGTDMTLDVVLEVMNHGSLIVKSLPSGASIYVNDVLITQKTNSQFDIDPGTYVVKLTKTAYDPWISDPFDIIIGQTIDINATLTETYIPKGTLQITSNPTGATVYVNGANKGKTPETGYLTVAGVPAGYASVKLTLTGYVDYYSTQVISENVTTTFNVIFRSPEASPTYTKVNEYLAGRAQQSCVCQNKLFWQDGDMLHVDNLLALPSKPPRLTDIRHAGWSLYGGNMINDHFVSNDNGVFVAHSETGEVLIINPTSYDVIKLPEQCSWGVAANNNLLFIANYPNVTIYDVSDISNPIKKNVVNISKSNYPYGGIYTKQGCPYLFANVSNNCFIYLIDTDANGIPTLTYISKVTASYASNSAIQDVAWKPNWLIVPNYTGDNVDFWNISNPSSPILAKKHRSGYYQAPSVYKGNIRYKQIALYNDDILIVGQHDKSYEIVDVRNTVLENPDPAVQPTLISDYWYREPEPITGFYGGYPRGLSIYGNYAIFSLAYAGIDIVDMSVVNLETKLSPVRICKSITDGACFSTYWDRGTNLAYTSVDMGIVVTNFNNTPATKETYYWYSGRGGSMLKEDNILYVCSSWAGLQIFDAGNPGSLVKLCEVYGRGYAEDFKKIGNYGFLLLGCYDGTSALEIYDLTNVRSNSITLIGTTGHIPSSNVGRNLAIKGNRAYITVGRSGVREKLYTIDISNYAANPLPILNEISEAQMIGWRPCGLVLDGNLLYVSNYYGGFKVFDVTADIPLLIGQYELGSTHMSYGNKVQRIGNYAYIHDQSGGTAKVDVTDPTQPIYLGKLSIRGHIYPDGLVMETNESNGLSLYSMGDVPPAEQGVLVLTSEPVGVNVYSGSELLGITPLNMNLDAGPYNLILKKSGYNDYSLPLTIVAGEIKYLSAVMTEIPAQPTTGILSIATDPAGADIIVGGVEQGHSPYSLTLEQGTYDVLLQLAGYYDVSVTAQVTAGQTTEIHQGLTQIEPQPTTAIISVGSTPSGAVVRLDDVEQGVTPLTLEVLPGDHIVSISMGGYVKQDFTISAAAGNTYPINVELVVEEPPPEEEPSNNELIMWGALALIAAYALSKIFSRGSGLSKSQVSNLFKK